MSIRKNITATEIGENELGIQKNGGAFGGRSEARSGCSAKHGWERTARRLSDVNIIHRDNYKNYAQKIHENALNNILFIYVFYVLIYLFIYLFIYRCIYLHGSSITT
jgi:hypothetical protein